MEESKIRSIRMILAVLALGLLVAAGTAFAQEYGSSQYDGRQSQGNDGHNWNDNQNWNDNHNWNDGHKPDFGHGDKFYDWLNPGGYYYTYGYYPAYTYSYYPASYYYYPVYQTYTPVYTYTAPAPVTTVTTPVVYNYDPWWAVNVYGLGTTAYYSSSWSWSYSHGGFFR